MTTNYYQEDPNPYNWTYDQDNIPPWKKILRGLKYHLTKNKSLIIRLRAIWTYILAELFKKRITFSLDRKWVSFEWKTFKIKHIKSTEEYEEDETGKIIPEESGYLNQEWEKYPWQNKWKQTVYNFTPFNKDQLDLFKFEMEYEAYRDSMCECQPYEYAEGSY